MKLAAMRFAPARLFAAVSAVALLALSAQAHAEDLDKRVDRLDKQVRELHAIVFQARDTGQPVTVKTENADPAAAALSSRMDDLEAALKKVQGTNEVLVHDLAQERDALAKERVDRAAQTQALTDRIAALEAKVANLAPPPPPPPPPEAVAPTKGAKSAAATSAAQAADTGSLNAQVKKDAKKDLAAPKDPKAKAAAAAAAELKAARDQLSAADYAGAGDAFESFLAKYPTDARAPEAYYWLGESYYVRDQYGDATTAYARALKGWPKTTWAGDALVKLARSLTAVKQPADACVALDEFDHRYSDEASAATKTRAAQARTKASCKAAKPAPAKPVKKTVKTKKKSSDDE
jgi:tol-pal system protein YbgF